MAEEKQEQPIQRLTLGPLDTHKDRIRALMELERYLNLLFAKQVVK